MKIMRFVGSVYCIFIVFLVSFAVSAKERLCMYPDSETYELEQASHCGSIENGLLTLAPSFMDKVMWSNYGMQCIYINYPADNGWFYINQNGLGRSSAFTQDNDCNGFRSGLAVGVSSGYVIYYNQAMDIIKSTDYTWASNFYQGYSKVCTGELTKVYGEQREHYQRIGGQCGFINRDFQVVIPVQYLYESTPEPISNK